MKTSLYKLALTAGLSMLVTPLAHAGDVTIITHPGTSLSANDVHDVYTGEKQFAGSVKLVPVDNAALQESFLSKVVQMPGAKYSSLWSKKAFRDGLTAPAVKSGDAEVIEFVKHTPGAVGYVGSSPSGVNVVK
jgi:hypothetical protein